MSYFQAVKKLLLQWHPDKNIERGEEAKILFQHLQKEMKRCEGGKLSVQTCFLDHSLWNVLPFIYPAQCARIATTCSLHMTARIRE